MRREYFKLVGGVLGIVTGLFFVGWRGEVLAVDQTGAVLGDVIINEVMWMGSVGDSNDEWMELRNMTSSPIDLTDWTIDGAKSGLPGTLDLSGTIVADGYFLIRRKASGASAILDSITPDMVVSGLSFVNGGEVLTLKDQHDSLIDETPSGVWAKGIDGSPEKQSMERNDTPGTGTSVDDWHTCIDSGCNSATFWDTEANDYGTPRSTNSVPAVNNLPEAVISGSSDGLAGEELFFSGEDSSDEDDDELEYNWLFGDGGRPAC